MKIIKKRYFISRESTQPFKRFKGLKLFTYKVFYKLGYSAIDLLICQTNEMKESFIENLPKLGKTLKIRVIDNPIAASKCDNSEESINLNYKYIISAGRYIPEKGFDILIKSFAKILLTFPSLKLVILGEGKERDNLSALLNELGLQGSVFLYGFVDNVLPFFKRAELCVVSSRVEGFPNVLLQMMSQNTKVVSTLCAGGVDKLLGVKTCVVNSELDLYKAMTTTLSISTEENRVLFDIELEKRSISNFVQSLESSLHYD